MFLREITERSSVFSSEELDRTKTRRIFRRDFAYLLSGDFGPESSELALAGGRFCP